MGFIGILHSMSNETTAKTTSPTCVSTGMWLTPKCSLGTEANSSGWKAPKPFFNVCEGFSLNHSSGERFGFPTNNPNTFGESELCHGKTNKLQFNNFDQNVLFVSQNLGSPLVICRLIGSESTSQDTTKTSLLTPNKAYHGISMWIHPGCLSCLFLSMHL